MRIFTRLFDRLIGRGPIKYAEFEPVGEPECPPDLVGWWNTDICYGPGDQTGDDLLFRDNGLARYEFWNFAMCTVDFFRWSHDPSGGLQIQRFSSIQIEDDDRYHESTLDEPWLKLKCLIRLEKTPKGDSRRVLRLAPDSRNVPFCDGPYGFLSRDPPDKPIIGYKDAVIIDRSLG